MKKNDSDRYSIGQFSKKTGISIQALRFYDREAVLKPERVSASGNRIYTSNSLKHANVVLQAKHNGFSLKEISTIMMALTKSKSCSCLLDLIGSRLEAISIQKKQLTESERFLKKLSSSCTSITTGHNCDALNKF